MDCYLLISDSIGPTVVPETKAEGPLLNLRKQPSSHDCLESADLITHEQVHSTFKGSTEDYPFTRKQIVIHMQI